MLEWIRGNPGLKSLPVVILTSSGETNDIQRARRLGARAYGVKPLETPRLAGLLRSIDRLILHQEPLPGGARPDNLFDVPDQPPI